MRDRIMPGRIMLACIMLGRIMLACIMLVRIMLARIMPDFVLWLNSYYACLHYA